MKLHFLREGSGPSLIMAHGIFGSLDNLGAISRILLNDFTLYRIDLRNHGASPHAPTMSFADMAEDLRELMDAENLESSFVFGHSLGGKVMMELALAHPERVKKLVVGDIAPVEYPAHHAPILDGLQAVNLATLRSRNDADQQMAPHIPELFIRQYLIKNLVRGEDQRFRWQMNLAALLRCYDDLRLAPRQGSFDKATLFIRGEKSNYIRELNHAEIFQKFPRARIETIADGSHWVHAAAPRQFAELMKNFLFEGMPAR